MTNVLDTDPATFPIATPELIPLGVSFADRLSGSETVASATITLTHSASGTLVPDALSGSVSVVSPVVTQVIDGSKLLDGARYEYVVTALIGTRKESTRTVLAVDF